MGSLHKNKKVLKHIFSIAIFLILGIAGFCQEAVDLGLSVKWATCNIGATKPEEYGNYYAWGETTTKSTYNEDSYKFFNSSKITKYCTDREYGTVDNKTTLEKSDDVAYQTLGGNWRMPTDAEWTELRTKCTWTWTTVKGIKGYKVTGKNGNSIFLPAAGYRFGSELYFAGSRGYYWSSSLFESYLDYAWEVYFDSSGVYRDYGYRSCGRSVRPVQDVK